MTTKTIKQNEDKEFKAGFEAGFEACKANVEAEAVLNDIKLKIKEISKKYVEATLSLTRPEVTAIDNFVRVLQCAFCTGDINDEIEQKSITLIIEENSKNYIKAMSVLRLREVTAVHEFAQILQREISR